MSAATSHPTLQQDAEHLYEVLSDLIRIYQFRDRDRICCHDLSVTQCYALEALVRQGPITMNELAGHLYLDKSTTSRVVDALERKGLLKRVTHPEDGRAVHLKTTAQGKARHRAITAGIRTSEMKLLAQFEPGVRRSMIKLIDRLATAAANRVDTTGGSCCCVE